MSTDTFIAHVAGHAGISTDHAERVTRSVLSGLGAWLTSTSRRLLAEELPAPLGAALLDVATLALPLEEHVLEHGITVGRARELVASVCRVLAEELSGEALHALHAAAPISIAPLLAAPAASIGDRPAEPRRNATLASGRPGSTHPISEARPRARQSGSVADGNPHDAAKLSSTTGTTQVRRHETFAEGQPGPRRSLAGGPRST